MNNILRKFQRTGTISHIAKYGAQYGDLSEFNYEELCKTKAAIESMYHELPSEIRREFGGPQAFLDYVGNPDNDPVADLPALAEPGTQLPQLGKKAVAAGTLQEPQETLSSQRAKLHEGSGGTEGQPSETPPAAENLGDSP